MAGGAGTPAPGAGDDAMIRALVCRLTGRLCTPAHPSSRDILKDLRVRRAAAEAQQAEWRRRRTDNPFGDLLGDRRGR